MPSIKNIVSSVFFSFAIVTLTLTGCLNLKIPSKIIKTSNNTVIKKANTLFPIRSFIIINQQFIFHASECAEEQCEKKVIGTNASAGSGFVIKSKEDESYVITAGHICVPSQTFPATIPDLEISYRTELVSGFGRLGTGKIIAVDHNNDICLLKVESNIGPALSISDNDLLLHEEVYNMASPAGLASPLAVPVFKGYYVGDVATLSIFSIPAVPGSSGSPIMTKDNKVVSLVSAAAVRFDEYAIGPTTKALREFLLAHLPED